MKEAEKEAERIIEMFLNVKSNKLSDHSKIEYPTAKLCALKYVEGIIESEPCKDLGIWFYDNNELRTQNIDFWEQVKQAIEKA